MIIGGAALLARFEWLIYVFGAFLLVYRGEALVHGQEDHHPERSWAYRTLRRVIPSTSRIEGHSFTLIEDGRRVATPLLLALILIELSDVVFALDSVPAIFGVTLDPFIVFTSNVFAILGLRSIYFVLARLMGRFEYLRYGLSAVLGFVGAKMLLSKWLQLPSAVSLLAVVLMLGASMLYRRGGRPARPARKAPGREPAPVGSDPVPRRAQHLEQLRLPAVRGRAVVVGPARAGGSETRIDSVRPPDSSPNTVPRSWRRLNST